MWREVTGKVVFSRRLERAFDCIFGIKNKNQEIWACTGLIVGPNVLAEPNLRIERRFEHGWKEAESPHATVQVRARESLIIVSYRLRSTWPFSKTLLRFCSFVTQVHGARRGERVFISRPARLEAEELTVLCMPPGGQTTSISQRTTFLKTRGAALRAAAAAASARCAPRRCPYSTPTARIITRYCPC